MIKKYKTFAEIPEEYGSALPYRYLLIYSMSSRRAGMTTNILPSIDWNQVTEFRCFDESGELHGFSTPENICTAEITESEESSFQGSILQYYSLISSLELEGELGDTLIIRRNISYDEDGQGCIVSSRCYGFTEGKYKIAQKGDC